MIDFHMLFELQSQGQPGHFGNGDENENLDNITLNSNNADTWAREMREMTLLYQTQD